jgi:hypothetical protein
MTLEKILDYAVPFSDSDTINETQDKVRKRKILGEMIEAYKKGEILNFDPMCISADIEELLKKYMN